MPDANTQVLTLLGEIRGELRGIRQVMQANHESTQQRIDDFATANETRFKGIEERLSKMESGKHTLMIRTGVSGASAGGLVAVVVELVRMGLKIGG